MPELKTLTLLFYDGEDNLTMYEGTSFITSKLSPDIDPHWLLARTAKEETLELDTRIAGFMLALWAYDLRDPLDHCCI